MRKHFNFLVSLCLVSVFFIASSDVSAQTCRISRDSIIAGQGATSYSDYVYDDITGCLTTVTITDSGSFSAQRYYVNYIDAQCNINKTEYFETFPSTMLRKRITYTYTSGKITKIDTEDFGSSWTTSYDISYSGSNISSILLTSSTGSPDFPGSFTNLNWQNGNVTSLTLLLGTDSIELAITFDDKNNNAKNLLNTEGATGLFEIASANNLVQAELVNDETIFGNPANQGTLLLSRSYTYSGNDVATMTEMPTFFDQRTTTSQYIKDCGVGIFEPSHASPISMYPNPATGYITINNGSYTGMVTVFDAAGKVMLKERADGQLTLDISHLNAGVYYVEVVNENETLRGKLLKN